MQAAATGRICLCRDECTTSICHAILQLLEAAHLSGEQQRALLQHRQAYLHTKAQLVHRANQFKVGFCLSSPSMPDAKHPAADHSCPAKPALQIDMHFSSA